MLPFLLLAVKPTSANIAALYRSVIAVAGGLEHADWPITATSSVQVGWFGNHCQAN